MADRARSRRPGPVPVVLTTVALFAGTFGFLTYQLRAGNDPALGAAGVPSATAASRPVLIRRVIKRKVITQVVPTPGSTTLVSSGPVTTSSAPTGSVSSPAPVTTSAS